MATCVRCHEPATVAADAALTPAVRVIMALCPEHGAQAARSGVKMVAIEAVTGKPGGPAIFESPNNEGSQGGDISV